MDRGAWQAAVHGVARSRTGLSNFTFTFHFHFSLFTFMHWRRKWQSTPLFLPGESQGWGSLMGCCLWGHTELDRTEVTQQQQQQQHIIKGHLFYLKSTLNGNHMCKRPSYQHIDEFLTEQLGIAQPNRTIKFTVTHLKNKTIDNPIFKRKNYLNIHFFKEGIQVSDKNMKRCLILSVIKE